MNFSKPHTLISAVVFGLAALNISAGAQEIPAGVNYKKAPDAINQKAKTMLETALAAPPEAVTLEAMTDGALVCGPLLWDALKARASKELQQVNPMVVIIGAAKPVTKEAKRVITPEQKKEFWKLFAGVIKQGNTFSVRKADAPDIQYYWATIPFDIDEPFYIIDFGKQRILVDFTVKNGEPKIFWMDMVGDLVTLK